MERLREIKSHQKAFDLLYSKSNKRNYSIKFPLEEIDKFKWERGPFGDLIYSYYYRRFTISLLSLLQIKDNQKILNIGCGFGFDEKNLFHLYSNLDIWSIDISEEMISMAVENQCPSKLCLSLAEALPFPDNSFDRIIAREVIEHVLSPKMMIREIYRCLKPGGVAVFTTEYTDSLAIGHFYMEVFYKKWANFMGYNLHKPPYKNCPLSPSEINNLAENSGFILEKVIWDGGMYHFLGSLLSQKILRSKITSVADFFSRLENMGSIDKFFCDQIKFKYRKKEINFNDHLIPKEVVYQCPSCHGKITKTVKNIECQSCGKIYPFIYKNIPNFVVYEFILPEKCLDTTRHILEELDRKKLFKQLKRQLFKFGDLGLRSIYLFIVFHAAFFLVLFKIVSKRPKIEKFLNIEEKLKKYLQLHKRKNTEWM